MSLPLLFREYELVIQNRESSVTINGARINFEITKSLIAQENTAYISIYNIGQGTRELISREYSTLLLKVGYSGNRQLSQLIFGDITSSDVTKTQSDSVTKLQVIEGSRRLRERIIDISLDNNPTLRDVLDRVSFKTGYPLKIIGLDTSAVFDKSYSDIGTVDVILDHIAQSSNFKWSLQNGTLLIVGLKSNGATAGFVLNSATGLLLNPDSIKLYESTLDVDIIEKERKNILALLQPNISVGEIIEVDSQDIKGTYRVTKIKHTGDSMANEWYSNIEID
jgi:hypothetical protein